MEKHGKISQIIENTPEFERLIDTANKITLVSQELATILSPPLLSLITVSISEQGLPVLLVESSATASKLNQLKSNIIRDLQKKIPKITYIEIRVTPPNYIKKANNPTARPMFKGKIAFDDLSRKLKQGTLKSAVDRFRKKFEY